MSIQPKISEGGQIAEQTALGVSEARADLVQHLEILLADGPETGEQWAEICRVEQQIADMDSAALSPAELNMINQAWKLDKPSMHEVCLICLKRSNERADLTADLVKALEGAEIAVAELCHDQNPANECWNILSGVRAALASAREVQP